MVSQDNGALGDQVEELPFLAAHAEPSSLPICAVELGTGSRGARGRGTEEAQAGEAGSLPGICIALERDVPAPLLTCYLYRWPLPARPLREGTVVPTCAWFGTGQQLPRYLCWCWRSPHTAGVNDNRDTTGLHTPAPEGQAHRMKEVTGLTGANQQLRPDPGAGRGRKVRHRDCGQ